MEVRQGSKRQYERASDMVAIRSALILRWIKKLHIYAGLLSFVGFAVWGIVGIWASFAPAPADRPIRQADVRLVDFLVDASATDQQVTDAMIEASGLPFIQPGRKADRDSQGRLQIRYLTPNGARRIVLLEPQNQIRIERTLSPLGGFLNLMHMQTLWIHNPGWEVQLWGAYNHFSLWSAVFLSVSGIFMWLATRPGLRWAQWAITLGAAVATALYVLLR